MQPLGSHQGGSLLCAIHRHLGATPVLLWVQMGVGLTRSDEHRSSVDAGIAGCTARMLTGAPCAESAKIRPHVQG